MEIYVQISLTYSDLKRLEQALSVARKRIMEIAQELNESSAMATERDVDRLMEKLKRAHEVILLRQRLAEAEAQLVGEE